MPGAKERVFAGVERTIVTALQVLVVCLTVAATVVLFVLFANNLIAEFTQIETTSQLLSAMQKSFAGILIVVLGLELLETLKTYFVDHHVKIEVIMVVALIAVGRHVIQADLEHTPGLTLIGISSIIVALSVGYFLIKKTHGPAVTSDKSTEVSDSGSGP